MNVESLRSRLQAAEQLAAEQSALGGMQYLRHVVIDSKPEPRPFRLIAQPWQWERARRIVPALDYAGGFTQTYAGPLSFAETYPRGHDKTSFLGRMANWLLGFSKKQQTIIVGAGDEEQAQLVTGAMRAEANLNPWLAKRLKFYKKVVRGPGGVLHILGADAKSSFGLRGTYYILDELTHWKKSDFWETLLSGRAKLPGAVFHILSNAGLLGTWQHDLFQKFKQDSRWSVFEAPGQLNTWMDPEQIRADRKLLPAGQAKRLFDNVWIDPAEESGYLTRPEVEACADLGRQLNLVPRLRGEPGLEYVAAIDYGPKRDRTVLVVGHQDPQTQLILIDSMSVWQGSPSDPVKLAAVRGWLDEARSSYPNLRLVIDPYQMEDVAQTYEAVMPLERFEARGGKSNYELAACLRSVIVNQQIAWYPGAGDLPVDGRLEGIVDELCGLVLKQMSYGYRIDHELTKHDDRAVALGMLCLMILQRPAAAKWVSPHAVPNPRTDPKDQWRPRPASRRILYGTDWTAQGDRRYRPEGGGGWAWER